MKAACRFIALASGAIALGLSVVGFELGMFTLAQLVVITISTTVTAYAAIEM